jgi:transposase
MDDQSYDTHVSTRVNRVEVVTRAERKRRWTDAEKKRIVEEAAAAGTTVMTVAKKHGLGTGQIYTWRLQAQEGNLGFVPVMADPGNDAPQSLASPGTSVPSIEIRTRTMSIRVCSGADLALVESIIRVLKADA